VHAGRRDTNDTPEFVADVDVDGNAMLLLLP